MSGELKPWVVCVKPRVVLFGYATEEEINKESPVLTNARLCVYWSADPKGVLRLASGGPTSRSHVSPSVSKHHIRTEVKCVMECSAKAAKAWEAEAWEERRKSRWQLSTFVTFAR